MSDDIELHDEDIDKIAARVVEILEEQKERDDTQELDDPDTGDIVTTPRGVGVVAGELRDDFEFPTGPSEESDEDVTTIEASSESPAYVVGFVGESAVYRQSDIEIRDVDGADDIREIEDEETNGEAIASVGHVDFEETDWGEGWDETSLMSFYASSGGEVTEMADDLQEERDISREEALGIAAEAKDQVLGTDRWRNRFSSYTYSEAFLDFLSEEDTTVRFVLSECPDCGSDVEVVREEDDE